MRIPMRAIRKIVIVPVAAALGLVALGAPMAHAITTNAVMMVGTDDVGTTYVANAVDTVILQSDSSDASVNLSTCTGTAAGTLDPTAVVQLTVNGTLAAQLKQGVTFAGGLVGNFDTSGVWYIDLINSSGTDLITTPGTNTISAVCTYKNALGQDVSAKMGTFTVTLPGITSDLLVFTPGCTTTVTAAGFIPGSAVQAFLAQGKDIIYTLLGSTKADVDGNVSILAAVPSNVAPTTSSAGYRLIVTDTPGLTGRVAQETAYVIPNTGTCPAPPVTPGTPGVVVAAESIVTPDTAVGLLTLGTARQSSGVDSYNIGISLNDKDGNIVTDQAASTLSVANLPVGATAKFTKNTDGTFNLFITSTVPGWFPVQVMYTPADGSTAAIGTPINLAFIGAAVTTDEVPANGTETVVGYGFQAYEWVVGIVHSNPMQTARVQADVNGKVTISFSVAQLAKGDHTVALQGDKSGITQVVPFTVCQIVSTGGSVVTSSAATTGIVVMLMMVAGLGVAAVRMRRSTL